MSKRLIITTLAASAACLAAAVGATPAFATSAPAAVDTGQNANSSEERPDDFTDNPPRSQYYTPVRWMQLEGVSEGYTDGTFRKYRDISRGESVAFIYRYLDPDFEADEDPFEDVTEDHTFHEAISWANDEDIARGYTDGLFRPGQEVTRAEFVAFLYRTVDPRFRVPEESEFTDVSTGHTHYDAITWATARGIVNGYKDGSFEPDQPIIRAEVAKVMHHFNARR